MSRVAVTADALAVLASFAAPPGESGVAELVGAIILVARGREPATLEVLDAAIRGLCDARDMIARRAGAPTAPGATS